MKSYLKLLMFPLLTVLIFTGSSCRANLKTGVNQANIQRETKKESYSDWIEVEKNIFRKKISVVKKDQRYNLLSYKFNPETVVMKLFQSDKAMRIDEWRDITQSHFIFNGGYFDEQNQPTGYYIINGNVINSHQYSTDKSGLLFIDSGRPQVIDTSSAEIAAPGEQISLLQSFPLLIKKGGTPGIAEDSNLLARRTVVGMDKDNNFLLIIVDQTPISLYTLMNVLLESDLNFDVALNLDGGPSTALSFEGNDFEETLLPLNALPQIISVTPIN